ncbi:MAG: TIGR02301 family protein, partial [Methyloceanibacter sp.]
GTASFAPTAEAQFFRWFQPEERPRAAPRPRAARPKPPGDDLPPIVPRESTLPPPPDDRPYDTKLMRLAEILGAVHYLRELCGAEEGQLWRDQMKEILKNEGTTAARRAKLVNSFNDGYRGYRRTYRSCTESATLASTRFSTEGATIAASLAQTSVFASGPPKTDAQDAAAVEATMEGAAAGAGAKAEAAGAGQTPAAPESPN